MRAWLVALLLAGATFGAGWISGHDIGQADGEARVRHYQQTTTNDLPFGYSVTTEADDTIVVTCPAEDSCKDRRDGRRIIITPIIP